MDLFATLERIPGSAPVPVRAALTSSSSLMRLTWLMPSLSRMSRVIARRPMARSSSAPCAGFSTAMPALIRMASAAAARYLSPSSSVTWMLAAGVGSLAAFARAFSCTSARLIPFSMYSFGSTSKCLHNAVMLSHLILSSFTRSTSGTAFCAVFPPFACGTGSTIGSFSLMFFVFSCFCFKTFTILLNASSCERPTPTVGSAGTDTMEISSAVHLVAT